MSQQSELDELKERLAAIEHERWADWQKWCHQVLRDQVPSSDELEAVLRRWDKQIATPYSQLSDKEKDSDREQVDRYWPLVLALLNKRIEFVIGENEQPHPTDRTLDGYKQARNLLRAEQRKRLGDIQP